jgi:structural maintenance of chromosome 2
VLYLKFDWVKLTMQDSHNIAQAHLDDERAKLTGFDDELRSLEDASRSKSTRITEESLEMQKLGHQIEKFHKEQQAAVQAVSQMEKEHEWIADEKDNFGRTGTPYDFKGQNIAECKASLRNLTERFQGMKKKINPKVMNMIDSVEKKEVALKNMMKTVIRDKKKIEETIVTLDEYKKKALHETWTKVNGDFGQIFAELLPGSFAKLDPPEGKTINEGLEVKVSLGLFSTFESHDDLTNTKNRQSVEAESYGAVRRAAFPHCTLPHHGAFTIQTGADVYP